MGRKEVLRPVWVNSTQITGVPSALTAGLAPLLTQSLAASFNTLATNVEFMDSVAYQIQITTSDSIGSFYLQMSNDGINFVDIGLAGTAAAANDTILCEMNQSRTARYIRLRYSLSTAGTGSCAILLSAKTIGA